MKKVIAFVLLLVSHNSIAEEFRHFSDWTTEEKAWFTTYAVTNFIDYKQTKWAIDATNEQGEFLYKEVNPIFGKRPNHLKIAAFKLIGTAGLYYAFGKNGWFDEDIRWGIKTAVILQVGVVAHNASIGAKISVAF